MKILHISHTGLPDVRVERNALTLKKDGHELLFLGGTKSKGQVFDTFDEIHFLPIGNDLSTTLNPLIRRKWMNKIRQLAPDVVHAHNVLVARFMLGLNIPTIYDDHEYWSMLYTPYHRREGIKGFLSKPMIFMIPFWERQLLKRFPTLTVSDTIAEDHRRFCNWVQVTKNVPFKWEVENLPMTKNRNGVVYVGGDFSRLHWHPLRNMAGIKKVLKFEILTGLPHQEMLHKLTQFKVGITPWRMFPVHRYSGPNKNYEYMHGGLQVVTNRLIKQNSFAENPYVHSYTNYSDINQVISNLETQDHDEIMKYAREKYIWENYEDAIREAYEVAY